MSSLPPCFHLSYRNSKLKLRNSSIQTFRGYQVVMLCNSIQKKELNLIYGNFGASATLTTQIRRNFFESRHLKNVPEIYSRSKPWGHKSSYVFIMSPSQFPPCFICLCGSDISPLLQPGTLFQQAWPSRQISPSTRKPQRTFGARHSPNLNRLHTLFHHHQESRYNNLGAGEVIQYHC